MPKSRWAKSALVIFIWWALGLSSLIFLPIVFAWLAFFGLWFWCVYNLIKIWTKKP